MTATACSMVTSGPIVRVWNDPVLRALDDLDLAHLRLDLTGAEAAVDDADAPSSAWTMAISARVTVSMLAETIGRFSVRRREKRDVRSILAGSRRSRTLCWGAKRKSSNVQPRTSSTRSRADMALSLSEVGIQNPEIAVELNRQSAINRQSPIVVNCRKRRQVISWGLPGRYIRAGRPRRTGGGGRLR